MHMSLAGTKIWYIRPSMISIYRNANIYQMCKHVQACGEQSPSMPNLWLSSAACICCGEQLCQSLDVQAMWGGRADGKTQSTAGKSSDPWPRSLKLRQFETFSCIDRVIAGFGAGSWVYVSRWWGTTTKMLLFFLQRLRQRPGCKLSTIWQIEFAVAVIWWFW